MSAILTTFSWRDLYRKRLGQTEQSSRTKEWKLGKDWDGPDHSTDKIGKKYWEWSWELRCLVEVTSAKLTNFNLCVCVCVCVCVNYLRFWDTDDYLAPSDFWLFPKLRGCRYETIEEMKEAVAKVIDTLTQEDFHGAFQKLLERYNKCIVVGGDYFEED